MDRQIIESSAVLDNVTSQQAVVMYIDVYLPQLRRRCLFLLTNTRRGGDDALPYTRYRNDMECVLSRQNEPTSRNSNASRRYRLRRYTPVSRPRCNSIGPETICARRLNTYAINRSINSAIVRRCPFLDAESLYFPTSDTFRFLIVIDDLCRWLCCSMTDNKHIDFSTSLLSRLSAWNLIKTNCPESVKLELDYR